MSQAEVGSCAAYSGLPSGEGPTAGMTFVAEGAFTMGSDQHQPEERFTHVAHVDGFWIDRHEVTNAQFKKFIDATGYVTLAERPVDPKSHRDWPQDMLVTGSVVFVPPKDAKGETADGGNTLPAQTGVSPTVRGVPSRARKIIP
jgi:formylglycine-generating enzyme